MKAAPDSKEICTIRDVFFHQEIEKSVPFFVRRGDFLRTQPIHDLTYGRLYDVPDEAAIRMKEVQKNEEAEANRDKTFEEFMAMFQDHIENKVDPSTRVGGRPDTPTGEGPEPVKKATIPATDARSNASALDKSQHQVSRYESIKSDGGRSGTSSRMVTAKSEAQSNKEKYELPKTCKLPFDRKLIVDVLTNGYYLAAHPYPQIEGEMLLF